MPQASPPLPACLQISCKLLAENPPSPMAAFGRSCLAVRELGAVWTKRKIRNILSDIDFFYVKG
jgi:hypothetical protein